jgi:hypothetical protein
MNIEEAETERLKCKHNPYYFLTKYVTFNGEPYKPTLSEEQYNNEIFSRMLEMGTMTMAEIIESKLYNKNN